MHRLTGHKTVERGPIAGEKGGQDGLVDRPDVVRSTIRRVGAHFAAPTSTLSAHSLTGTPIFFAASTIAAYSAGHARRRMA